MVHSRCMVRANTGSNGKKNRHTGCCRAAGMEERAGRACPVQGERCLERREHK